MANKITRSSSVLALLTILFFCSVISSFASDVGLRWDANTEDNLAGYKVYYKTASSGPPYNGTGSTEGNSPIEVPLNQDENPDPGIVDFTVTGLSDSETYYFVVTAYNDENLESGYSNEVLLAPGTPPPDIFDINVDNTIDILDVTICVNVILGTETDTQAVARADVNDDGTVDILDVMGIVNEILGM